MLKGTSHSPDEVVARAFVPEGLGVTVRQVAINAVMAGCLPEQMPVLLATIEAYQKFNLNSMLRSTNSFAFMQVVNGPIAKSLKMNSGVNAVGPGNQANAAMGRALRLFITNLGGGAPGVNIMAVIGANSNYSFMFAENEEQSPWEPLSVSPGLQEGRKHADFLQRRLGAFGQLRSRHGAGRRAARSCALPASERRRAHHLAAARRGARARRHEQGRRTQVPAGERDATGAASAWRSGSGHESQRGASRPDNQVPVYQPGTIDVIVAGGDAAPMMQAWHMYRPQTVSIDKWR